MKNKKQNCIDKKIDLYEKLSIVCIIQEIAPDQYHVLWGNMSTGINERVITKAELICTEKILKEEGFDKV